MIVAVKRNKKQKFIKLLSLVAVVLMFAGYYMHMSAQFEEQQQKEMEAKKAALLAKELKKEKKEQKKKLERVILAEVEKAVDLVGQENIRHVKIIENKLVLICEPKTNLDALMVRYGTMALIKNTLNEIIIAIDVKYIIESRLNA